MTAAISTDGSALRGERGARERDLTPAQQASRDIEKSVMQLGETFGILSRRLDHVLRAPTEGDIDAVNKRAEEPSAESSHTQSLRQHQRHVDAIRREVEMVLNRLDV